MAKENSSKNVLTGIIGLLFIIGILFLLVKGGMIIVANLDKLNATIIVAILAGTTTILGVFITRYFERKKTIEQQIREQKVPIYQDFLGFVFKVLRNSSKEKEDKLSGQEIETFFWEYNQKSILWLSDNTLKSYIQWKSGITKIMDNEEDDDAKTLRMMVAFENLLLDFRKDIGHKNKGIKQGDILSLFIIDWHKFVNKGDGTKNDEESLL
jgi:hypothetical protein